MATAGRKGILRGGSRENRQNTVLVCGQVRAGAPALLYISPRRLHRRCAHPCNTGVKTFSRPFFKRTPEPQKTRIIPENAFCSFARHRQLTGGNGGNGSGIISNAAGVLPLPPPPPPAPLFEGSTTSRASPVVMPRWGLTSVLIAKFCCMSG